MSIVPSHLPALVLVHGLKESGKSTLADHLCTVHGYERVKMAGPLKNMLRSLLRDSGITDEEQIERYIEGDLKNVPLTQMSGRTPRELMQTLGDEWRRMQAEDFWIDIASGKVDQLHAAGRRVVIDDIRYPNEFRRFSVYNSLNLVITRGDLHFQPFDETRHPSERPMPVSMFHGHLSNDFETREELWNLADGVLGAWTVFRSSLGRIGAVPQAAAFDVPALAA